MARRASIAALSGPQGPLEGLEIGRAGVRGWSPATLVFAGSGVDNTCVSVLSPWPSEGKLDDGYRLRLD